LIIDKDGEQIAILGVENWGVQKDFLKGPTSRRL
jgi:hypothetical protein